MGSISNYIASQCARPHGIIGSLMTWAMNRANHVMYKGIMDALNVTEQTRILDVGFGNGYLEKLLMQKCRCFITGIDISEDMVKNAASLNRRYISEGRMQFQLGDCCDLAFPNNCFDVVTTMNTIYFWKDTAKGMSEIYRVLKKGGMFYNAVLTKESLDRIFYTKNGFQKFTGEDYRAFGKQAGFRNIRIKSLGKRCGLLIQYQK